MKAYLRPAIASVLVVAYLALGGTGAYLHLIDANSFITNLGSMVGMILAFLFGERAALKKPGEDGGGG